MHSIKDTVKQLIGKSLDAYNKKYTSPINNRIDNIVAQAGTDNTEIVDARIDSAGVSHTTLNNRILAETKMTDEKLIEYTGSSLSVEDTMPGYLQNIEIKGNTIQNEDNLEDIRSVGDKIEGQELYEIPVLSCGKNLFNIDGIKITSTNCSVTNNGGVLTIQPSSYNGKNYAVCLDVDIKSGTYFYTGKAVSSTQFRNGGAMGEVVYNLGASTNKVINLAKDVDCIVLNYTAISSGVITFDLNSIQIEEGTVATPYEPYQEDKLTILSPTPLEKVGDVRDRIIEKDGVWGVEKNVETVVFDGTEDWGLHQSSQTNCITVRLSIPNRVYRHIGMSNLFVCKGNVIHEDIEGIMNSGNANEVYINVSKSKATTLLEWKNYLSENNMIFLYVTNNPTFIPLPHDQQVKLRTFANKTNISFLTEIEGTIKAQVPKSLGATVNTHTTQISNLNKELDRVKKLEESTVSTVETESDFTTVEATSNGYFEDVKLEGKTLVNLWDINSILKSGQTVVKNNRITVTTTNNIYSNFFYEQKSKFKPLTEYTIIVDIYKNTLQTNDVIFITSYSGASSAGRDIFATNGGTQFSVKGGIVGRIVKRYTTISDFSEVTYSMRSFVSNNSQTEGGELELAITVLEGDHTQNPPSYFEGLKSVGQGTDEIVVSSVNSMCCNNEFELGMIATSNGNFNPQYTEWCSLKDYIKVNANTEYYVCFEGSEELVTEYGAFFYNGNSYLSYSDLSNNGYITTPANANRMKVRYKKKEGVTSNVYNFNLVIAKSKTNYQSDKKRLLFYNDETQTWEKPILREWDSIEKHADGKYYYHQRSGEVVLNGSENWNSGTEQNTTIRYQFTLNNIKLSSNLLCDKFKQIPGGTDSEGVSNHASNNILQLTLNKDKGNVKQWLQTNNFTVVYQLAEEKIYECTNIDLITYANETNYIVESGAIVPKTTLKVHNNISNAVSLLQKKVSLLESNMTKYMVTQNRMQLASTYSADSVTFKVDYALCSEEVEYNEDLYNLILNNILVGKDNYNYDKMFTMILDYASWNQISWEQFDILVGLMDMQHNPPVEDEVIEEIPNEIM